MRSELEQLCDQERVKTHCQYGGVELPDDWQDKGAHPYKVVLRYRGRQLTTPFFCGSAWTREPNVADVLSSLILDASCGDQSFEDFCSDFGYDEDSRKAERTWRDCTAMTPRVKRFLGERFEAFTSAEH